MRDDFSLQVFLLTHWIIFILLGSACILIVRKKAFKRIKHSLDADDITKAEHYFIKYLSVYKEDLKEITILTGHVIASELLGVRKTIQAFDSICKNEKSRFHAGLLISKVHDILMSLDRFQALLNPDELQNKFTRRLDIPKQLHADILDLWRENEKLRKSLQEDINTLSGDEDNRISMQQSIQDITVRERVRLMIGLIGFVVGIFFFLSIDAPLLSNEFYVGRHQVAIRIFNVFFGLACALIGYLIFFIAAIVFIND